MAALFTISCSARGLSTTVPSASPPTLPFASDTVAPVTGAASEPAPNARPSVDPLRIEPENAKRLAVQKRYGQGDIRQAALSPNGQLIAILTTVGLYLSASDSPGQYTFLNIPAHSIAFSPDSRTLAVGLDGLQLLDLQTLKLKKVPSAEPDVYTQLGTIPTDG